MGLIKTTGALMLITLFALAVITFAANFANDNEAAVDVGDDEDLSSIKTKAKSDLSQMRTDAETSIDALQDSSIGTQSEATEGGTQFKVTATNSLGMAKNVLTAAWNSLFGKAEEFNVLLTALISFFTLVIGWYIYKAWRGNPD